MDNLSLDNTSADDASAVSAEGEAAVNPSELALVQKIQKIVQADKDHHKAAFEQMRKDMFLARFGRTKEYPDEHYKANLAGRHVKQKTASLYAKNPKATARRRESMDFVVWDENPQSLQIAMQTLMQLQQMLAGMPIDPATGQPIINEADPTVQQALIAFETAQKTVADFQQGMERRTLIQKIGKTLEILFAYSMREQKPVDFKMGMKQLVRRACTTCVGYIELGFQREYGPRPAITEKLADFRARLDHLRVLTEKVSEVEDPIAPDDPEIAELEHAVTSLQAEPEVVVREGLVVDFPQSTMVIPDKLTRELMGFVGARHLTIEYMYTPDQVREIFGVDLKNGYSGYVKESKNPVEITPVVTEDNETATYKKTDKDGLARVWKHYDKAAGLVYYVAEGYCKFLREPAAPDVFVEDFWPVYALTFNAVESEDSLFPPSDVYLLKDQQMEYNRSRQGMREHRQAARPRWVFANGALDESDTETLGKLKAFEAKALNLPSPTSKIADILQAVPVPGVDPNLYETNQLFTDMQFTVGSQEAQFGGVAKATATESAIAANSTASSDSASIDDLDSFLSVIARASGQILLREMSEEKVKEIVGVGAVWPQMTLADIAGEVYLEVEAGSTGKPNQAIEVDNMQKLAPFLLQIPELDKRWLAKQFLMRLDDKLDLTDAFAAGAPSIMAQNAMTQKPAAPAGGDPESDPAAQGGKGADNAPRDDGAQRGSEPAFGSNQV